MSCLPGLSKRRCVALLWTQKISLETDTGTFCLVRALRTHSDRTSEPLSIETSLPHGVVLDDETRVVLNAEYHDYINANFVSHEVNTRLLQYIATQAPKEVSLGC